MNPEEIRQKLHAIPFISFRVYTSDGKHLDVINPEMAMLTRMAVLIARPVDDPTCEIPAHYVRSHIAHYADRAVDRRLIC